MATGTIELRFADESAWQQVCEQLRSHNGMMTRVEHPERIKAQARVELAMRGPDGVFVRVEGEVVMIDPAGQAAFTFATSARDELRRMLHPGEVKVARSLSHSRSAPAISVMSAQPSRKRSRSLARIDSLDSGLE